MGDVVELSKDPAAPYLRRLTKCETMRQATEVAQEAAEDLAVDCETMARIDRAAVVRRMEIHLEGPFDEL